MIALRTTSAAAADRTTPRPGEGVGPGPPDAARRALRGLFGRDAVFMAALAGQLVVAALATPLVTRLMERDQFGLVASTSAAMQVLFVLGGAGLATAIQRQYARGHRRDARRLLAVAIASTGLVTAVAHLTGPAWAPVFGFPGYEPILWLAVTWAGAAAVTNSSLALIRSQDRLLRFVTVGVAQSIVAELAGLALLATFVSPAAELYVLGKTAAQVVAMVLGLAFALPALPRPRDRGMVAASLRFSIPLVPTALSTFVLSAGDRLILQRLLGPDAVGAYQAAYNVGSVPILLLGLLSMSWLPRLFGLDAERSTVLAASRDAVYRLALPVVVGMAVAGPLVLRLWVPPGYRPETLTLTLAIVVVCLVPEAAAAAATRTLLTAGRSTAVAVGNVGAATMNVLLNLVLIPPLGLVGAALATLVSLTALWLTLHLAARPVLALPPPPWRLLGGLWVCSGVAVASTLAPVGDGFLLVRLAVGLLAVAWLLAAAARIRSGTTAPGGRTGQG